jgi:glycosyltransferase involved in cell wall biosynthesis
MYVAERRLDAGAVARADRIATNSAFSAQAIERAYGRSPAVIPLGVPERFHALTRAEPAHLLSVGTLIASKGHELVIAAAAQARRRWPVLVIAPRANPAEQRRLEALADRMHVPLEVRVGVSDEELGAMYASAFATAYMASGEPFGLVSLEAQAAGCPVIVAAEGGLPETIRDGESGWAVARTPDALAAKLDELERPGVRDALSVGARRHAGPATWDRSANAVKEILDELCTP